MIMTNQELIEKQKALEEESLGLGIKHYREALAARGEDNLPPGMKLMKLAIEPLSKAIDKAISDGLAGKASRSVGIVQYLSQFNSDAVAFMCAKTVMHHLGGASTVQKVAVELSSRLEGMLNYDNLKAEAPRAHKRMLRLAKESPRTAGGGHVVVAVRQNQKYLGLARIRWGVGEKLKLGTYLIHLMCEETGLAAIQKMSTAKNRTPHLLTSTDATRGWLEQSHARCELLSPFYMPMVCPPLDWKGPHGGGYLTKKMRYPLIKTMNKSYLAELEYVEMPMVYEAVNALQHTAWQVNPAVVSVLRSVWEGGGRIGKLPAVDDEPLPALLGEERMKADPEALREWKTVARRIHDSNFRARSKRLQVSSKLWVAEKFEGYNFHFPYALDWRGRAYPVAAGLNPQGDDVARGLLRFAEGKELGTNGAYWLAMHGANVYGADKITFDQRVAWVQEHQAQIIESATNPLDGSRWWATADKPYSFLAFCFEWLGYTLQGDSYVSHLPIAFDGTCNGLQNFAAMLRDETGGEAVGLVPTATPPDIYTEVSRMSNILVAQDAAAGNAVAQRWVGGKITRQLTKQNTMTTPYGVSAYGMKEQILDQFQKLREEGHDFGQEGVGLEDAQYVASVNHRAIGDTVKGARVAMDWLQGVAKIVASNGLPVSWTTPAGLPVLQSYRKVFGKSYDFDIEGKRFRMILKVEGDELDRRRQAAGISPNFVHSLDASHLMRTITYGKAEGINAWCMIHDSYGTHAADADTLSYQLRRAFVDQYEDNVLEDFRAQLVAGLPSELAVQVPPTPPMGTLDLDNVMNSEYFFA
jgi:DNA-directed RNA polymerase